MAEEKMWRYSIGHPDYHPRPPVVQSENRMVPINHLGATGSGNHWYLDGVYISHRQKKGSTVQGYRS